MDANELTISSRSELIFHPGSESSKLKDKTRAIVKGIDGFYEMAVWFSERGWYDEGSCIYSGVGGEITDVVEFSINLTE